MDRPGEMARDWWARNRLKRTLRRYLVPSLVDGLLVALAYLVALAKWFGEGASAQNLRELGASGAIVALSYVAANLGFGVYGRVWRQATIHDAAVLARSSLAATAFIVAANWAIGVARPLDAQQILLGGMIAFFLLLVKRDCRLLWGGMQRTASTKSQPQDHRTRAIIVGAGDHGCRLAQHLQDDPVQSTRHEVVGFIDDDQAKVGLRVHGLKVLGTRTSIPAVVRQNAVEQIIIASPATFGDSLAELVSICQSTSALIKTVPRFGDLLENHGHVPNLRPPTIEELLGRAPVRIDEQHCRETLHERVVLVTGAAGSIGSELCRQLVRLQPKRLVLVDNNETGLHDLYHELKPSTNGSSGPEVVSVVGDITNARKMESLFRHEAPQIVYHAAAYKHVPMMEAHPDEAVRVNVVGTLILSELADRYGAERFIFISTDKAVNPSCVMGASKRLGELWISAIGQESRTQFSIVRFGNVVGSRGSVLPLFDRQIESGGPVTVTDARMTRYFMSIPEAASLIIEASVFAEGGVYMLDMGQPVQILELAQRMIRLKGLRPGTDIEIQFIGPRPGEKLDEELSYRTERKHPTPHPKIYRLEDPIAPVKSSLVQQIAVLIAASQSNQEMIGRLGPGIIRAANGDVDGCLEALAATTLSPKKVLPSAQVAVRLEPIAVERRELPQISVPPVYAVAQPAASQAGK